MELNDCLNFELSITQNAVLQFFKGRLAPYGITPIQYALLQCLWKEDLQTPTQLSQALRLDTSSITGILARLEKKELIQRVYSQEDRRSIHVHLLPRGKELQSPIETTIAQANEAISAGMDPAEYDCFRRQLHRIESNAKALSAK